MTTLTKPGRRALLTLGVLMLLVVAAAGAETYTVTLHNGNTFLSKYKPVDATFDDEYIVFMTDVGNIVSLNKAEVADIISETESRGFGTVINTTTVLIGNLPNDNPTEEEAREAAELLRNRPQTFRPGGSYSAGQFDEPPTFGSTTQPTGGLPVGFATGFVQTPP